MFRSGHAKEVEILVLRHEAGDAAPPTSPAGSGAGRPGLVGDAQPACAPRARCPVFMVGPATLLGWHRRLVGRRWTFARKGRPPLPAQRQRLIVRPRRTTQRGAISGSGGTGRPRSSGRGEHDRQGPAGAWDQPGTAASVADVGGSSCVSKQRASWPAISSPWTRSASAACTSCSCIHHDTRRVWISGVTEHPCWPWVTPLARNVRVCSPTWDRGQVRESATRDAKFGPAFDAGAWAADGATIVRTPVRAPNANAIAERWSGPCGPSAPTGC